MRRSMAARKKMVLKRLFRASVRLGAPWLSGLILAFLTVMLNRGGRRRVLYFGSAASFNDLEALMEYSGEIQYLYIERWYFGHILRKYVPYGDLKEINYHHEEKYKEGLGRTNEYIGKLVRTYRLVLRFDAVMTSNIGFKEQQEVLSVCRQAGVPIIVLYREGLGNPYILEQYIKGWRRRKANCDLFICHNDLIKETIVRNRVTGLQAEKISVCGIPRLDAYVRRNGYRPRQSLVFFTYDTHIKFAKYLNEPEILKQAEERTRAFTQYVFRLAEERGDIEVILKTKPSKPKLRAVEQEARDYFGSGVLPSNLRIVHKGFAEDLIMKSRWVLCISNSTIVLEALAAGRRVACPFFDELVGAPDWDLLEGSKNLITHISGYSDLIDFVKQGNAVDVDNHRTEELLKRYFHRVDGQASARVESEIHNVIEHYDGAAVSGQAFSA